MSGTATGGLESPAGDTSVESAGFASLSAQVPGVDYESGSAARAGLGAEAGRLADVAEWLAAAQQHAPPVSPRRPRCVLIADGQPAVTSIADPLGAGVCRVAAGSTATHAFRAGVQAADAEVDQGADLVVLVAPAPEGDAAAAALVGVLRALEPTALLPRGTAALDSAAWCRRAEQVRDTRRTAMQYRSRPDALLTALGSPELAATTGFLLRATARRTPLVLDGVMALAAALLIYDVAPRAVDWWQAADVSADPLHTRVCEHVGLKPLLTLGVTLPDGTAGLLTLPLVRAAAAAAR